MHLDIHDTEEGNTLAGRVNHIEYDYQAEQWVQDLMTQEVGRKAKFPLARIVLIDDDGERAEWTIFDRCDAELTSRSPRFTGEWQLGARFQPRNK